MRDSRLIAERRKITKSRRAPARRPGPRLLLWAAAALLLLPGLAAGAGGPDVVRVRVASDKVSAAFPPGTELRGMSADAFEALVVSARSGAERQAGLAAPRLLRARHFARWDPGSGLLIGRSELVVEPSGSGPSELVLDPWSPAIDVSAGPDRGPRIGAREDGRTLVRVNSTETATLALGWQLRARPSSSDRGFSLGLPATETASLELDLPDGWIPDGPSGIRRGPEPGDDPRRKTWRFEGRGGAMDLHFRERGEGRDLRRDARIWVSGPTRIELLESSANWTMDWSVDAGPRGPRQFAIDLDPGLELLDVTGPGVDEFQAEAFHDRTRVLVRLTGESDGPSPVSVRAVAWVPSEGTWTVPSARPLDALWTGGNTSVRLDASRVLEGCRERSGRRIAPTPGEPSDPYLLIFEPREPGPVADLEFRRPRADVTTEVRGRLVLGNSAPRLEAQMTWRVHRGLLLGLDVDLPPLWAPDRVRIAGIEEPPAWHPEAQPGGGIRLHVVPPTGALARGSLVMTVEATATVAGGRGPLALPRVRPAGVGVQVGDELWVAWIDPSLSLRPVSARGLAWVDPRLVTGATTQDEGAGGLLAALAWRWIAPGAEARVDRERVEAEPSGTVDLRASVARDRVRYDWQIAIQSGQNSLVAIPMGTGDAMDDAADWHFQDEATGLDLAVRPIETRGSSALAFGFPETGRAWELRLPHPRRGLVSIRAWLERPWNGRGDIPLLALPERFHARGTVVIAVDRSVRSTVEASGLRVLDPSVAARDLEIADPVDRDDRASAGPGTRRPAHAFGYTSADGRLDLRTENLEPARNGGVIREATLVTTVHPEGVSRHQLTLRIAADRAQSFDLFLPDGAVLARVRRDGQSLVPSRIGTGLSIPLPPPHASRSFCTVTLDYMTSRGRSSGETILSPERPRTSFPCLSFCWEVVAPEPWAVVDAAPGLAATDPDRAPDTNGGGWSAWSGLGRALARLTRRSSAESPESSMLRELDARVLATRPDEVTLGEWFTRWDSGPRPIVIDRLTLASAGFGPKSRVVPLRLEPSQPGAALAALRPLGLTIVPFDGLLLVTTQSEAPEGPVAGVARSKLAAVLREAMANGYDGSDRFQTVTQWRGEATPKVTITGEAVGSDPLAQGWRRWRFAAPGWPDPDASAHLIDEQRRAVWGWTLGLAIILAGIAGRRLRAPRRAIVLTLLLATLVPALALCPARDASIVRGVAAGALAVLFFWLGRSMPGRTRARPRGEPRSLFSVRLRPGGLTTGLLIAAGTSLAGLAAPGAIPPRDVETPIVALFPYDGPPDSDRRPDRVVLRWKDAERLQSLAAIDRARPGAVPCALAATHHVSMPDEREVVVESEFTIARGDGPSPSWVFPVEDAREITATLDGRAVPIEIRPEGRNALVRLGPEDRQQLVVRRSVNPRRGASEPTIRLAINPVATARVSVEDATGRPMVEVTCARGRIESRAGGVEGLLGPVDRLDVRWSSGVETEPAAATGTVEGLLLWDAEPAGDHVRARLTCRKAGGTSTLRLALSPGLVLRAGTFNGLVDTSWKGTVERPEWVAAFDPPLPDGATIPLEFWRPAVVADAPGSGRSLPRIEPLGVERYSGALGFRRPAEWSGRLAAGTGFEPMTDEAFVKAWGNLSDEPLTLAGTIRFLRTPAVSLATGPTPDQPSVEPEVQLAIEPGRITMDLRASLVAVSGRRSQVDLDLPRAAQIVSVEGDGLTDWGRQPGDRVRLRFDGTFVHRREVRLRAWFPLPTDPLSTGVAHLEVDIPWPRWTEIEVRPGKLTVASMTRFQLLQATGLVPSASNTSNTPGTVVGPAIVPYRAAYWVDRPEVSGRLTWDAEPPQVKVLVQSQLTILPDVAEWVAVLRYDVSGGASEAVHLKLPATWGASARVVVMGDGHQLATETRGASTFWMIRPEHPNWGSQRLVVRSSLALPKGGELTFPDLVPLGRGAVDSYIALVNASGRELVTEGSPGLQPVVDETRFRAEEFAGPRGGAPSVFHVRREGWSLKVQWPDEPRPGGLGDDRARVSLADLCCTLRDDGSLLGLALYEVEPRSGPFLAIDPPARSEPLWASVNNLPTPPLKGATGRWLIPMGDEAAGQVQVPVRLIWKTAPDPRAVAARPLVLPALDQVRVPTFVTVHAPTSLDVRSPDQTSLESVPRERLEIERVEWQGKRIADSLSKLDRSSLRDCEALISDLVQFELLSRDAERAALWNLTTPPGYRDVHIQRLQERARLAGMGLGDAIRNAALDEFAESARIHLGLVADDPDSSTLEIPEPSTHVRLRRVGHPSFFQSMTTTRGRPLELIWGRVPPRRPFDRPLDRVLVVLGLIAAPLAVGLATTRGERTAWLGPALLGIALIATAAVAGPLGFVAGLALGGLGWAGRPSRAS